MVGPSTSSRRTDIAWRASVAEGTGARPCAPTGELAEVGLRAVDGQCLGCRGGRALRQAQGERSSRPSSPRGGGLRWGPFRSHRGRPFDKLTANGVCLARLRLRKGTGARPCAPTGELAGVGARAADGQCLGRRGGRALRQAQGERGSRTSSPRGGGLRWGPFVPVVVGSSTSSRRTDIAWRASGSGRGRAHGRAPLPGSLAGVGVRAVDGQCLGCRGGRALRQGQGERVLGDWACCGS